jgi:molybdopterin-guanine dinucleotide biosynthesis protein A
MHTVEIERPAAPLWGLVLAGGRGSRLGGVDKGELDFHGVPQVQWAVERLLRHCERVYVSVRRDQASRLPYCRFDTIVDDVSDLGPAEGLLSAWRVAPPVAWLVLAADMPLIDDALLAALVGERSPQARGVAYVHDDGIVEPLCAIYEPAMREFLVAEGERRSLRHALVKAGARTLRASESWRLVSVNSAEDEAAIRARLTRS